MSDADEVVEGLLYDLDYYESGRPIETRRKRWNMTIKSRGDRMWVAFIAAAALAVGIPVLVGLALTITMALLYSFGMSGHWIHHHIWGWLTDFDTQTVDGNEIATPKLFPLTYFTSVVCVYCVYLIGEGITWLGQEFAWISKNTRVDTKSDHLYRGSAD